MAPKRQEAPSGAGGRNVPLEEVVAAIKRVKYGSVLVKIHQGKIVGYEITEKVK